MAEEKCFITGETHHPSELVQSGTIRKNLADFIREEHPGFNDHVHISQRALQEYRHKYLEKIIQKEIFEADKVEREVVSAISKQEAETDPALKDDEPVAFGQRMADKVASFGGSWTFIISFGVVLCIWIVLNTVLLLNKGFDPYPYILLNLILSCIASLQAPVIMMSQNRQETKDRQRSEYDYKVNLKAELEIRLLHEKLDHLMIIQMQKIMEFQQMQMDYIEELAEKQKSNSPS